MAHEVVGECGDQANPLGRHPVGLLLGLGQVPAGLILRVVADRLSRSLGRVDDGLKLVRHLIHGRLDRG